MIHAKKGIIGKKILPLTLTSSTCSLKPVSDSTNQASGAECSPRLPLRQIPLLLLPRFLTGFRLGDWWCVLRKHRFLVHPVFWPRAALATVGAAVTSCLLRYDRRVAKRLADEKLWEQPVFILGLPRSGTTHLFELLSQSPDLCYPTRFDVFNPHTFLFLRRIGLFALLSRLPKLKRAMDNLRVGWDSPEEDDIALAILTQEGERMSRIFPQSTVCAAESEQETSDERDTSVKVLKALRSFTKKLVLLHGKRALLKSPRHTGRLAQVLEIFPQAKFVVIYRNPVHQLASVLAMWDSGNSFWCALQWPLARSREYAMRRAQGLLRRFFRARSLMPRDRTVEITFEELVADRAGTIDRICKHLSLAAPADSAALDSLVRKSRSPRTVPDSWLPELRECYEPMFAAGIYPRP